jgi:hypothetical protein
METAERTFSSKGWWARRDPRQASGPNLAFEAQLPSLGFLFVLGVRRGRDVITSLRARLRHH